MMKRINQAGGIVLNKSGQVLMVKALSQAWTFPKGSLKKDEDLLNAAKREICEETGINQLDTIKKLGSYERPGFTHNNLETPSVVKHITFFFFTTDQKNLAVDDKGTLSAEWVNINDVLNRLTYDQDKDFFVSHKQLLKS